MESLRSARERCEFDLWAYVIMPEHVHLLIQPTRGDYDIGRILASIKIPVARRAASYLRRQPIAGQQAAASSGERNGEAFHFWQRGGGYDRNLVSAEAIHSAIAYIHANPVRRGLVESPADWYWSSAAWFLDGGRVPLATDADSLPARPV